MNVHLAQELLNELGSSLEALETQNGALLQYLKDKGIVTDEQLAPYIDQAGNASSVRWMAARVRLQSIFTSAMKEENKKAENGTGQMPRGQAAAADQEKAESQRPEKPAKIESKKEDKAAASPKIESVETKPETGNRNDEADKTTPAKPEGMAA